MKHAKSPGVEKKRLRRGRPIADDNQDIRQRILESAEQAFARSSFDSVSLKHIAQPAGITPAMIHYYFGSKMELLESVVQQALEPIANTIEELRREEAADIQLFVSELFATMQLHPNLPLLMFRQVLLPGSPMQEHFLKNLAPRLGGALPGLIQQGQRAGHISSSIDPSFAALMVISLCVFPLVSMPLSQPALGLKFDEKGMANLQAHAIRFIQRGLQTP